MAAALANILDMLQERSQRGRDQVFRHVADLVLSGTLPEPADDRVALLDVLRILRPKVSIGVRRELSGHLYSMERPPESLLEIMLEDEESVSGPLLDYATIPDAMLDRLATSGPIEILSRIKRRSGLSPTLRDRIDRRFAPKPEPAPAPAPESAPAPLAPPQLPKPQLAKPPPDHSLYPALQSLEAALADARNKGASYGDFVRVSSDWQWEIDRHGNITYLSESAARAFGRPVTTLLDQPFLDVVKPRVASGQNAIHTVFDRRRAFDDVTIATPGFAAPEQAARAVGGFDGTAAWKLAAVPLFDMASGRFQGYRGVAEAMDDMKVPANADTAAANNNGIRAEHSQQPVQAPSLDTHIDGHIDGRIGDAIQALSHELRTPLNAIMGFSEMIQLETWGAVNNDYQHCVQSIMAAAHQLNDLITDILENTRIRPELATPYPKSFSLSSTMQESIDVIRNQSARCRVTVRMPVHGVRAIVHSDQRLVHYALVRLLRCALEDSRPDTIITLNVMNRDDGSIAIDIPFTPKPAENPSFRLSALSRFRIKLSAELATAIGATVSERIFSHNKGGGASYILSLCLPPHNRVPGADFSVS
ncbi:MAG: histidine kinase dimerization/phospho-acceptor domain-containing protein [Sphingomonadales bacterium]